MCLFLQDANAIVGKMLYLQTYARLELAGKAFHCTCARNSKTWSFSKWSDAGVLIWELTKHAHHNTTGLGEFRLFSMFNSYGISWRFGYWRKSWSLIRYMGSLDPAGCCSCLLQKIWLRQSDMISQSIGHFPVWLEYPQPPSAATDWLGCKSVVTVMVAEIDGHLSLCWNRKQWSMRDKGRGQIKLLVSIKHSGYQTHRQQAQYS